MQFKFNFLQNLPVMDIINYVISSRAEQKILAPFLIYECKYEIERFERISNIGTNVLVAFVMLVSWFTFIYHIFVPFRHRATQHV